jgi:imidazolonepropionase-like amidohydrolase
MKNLSFGKKGIIFILTFLVLGFLIQAAEKKNASLAKEPPPQVTVISGATIIDGTGHAPINDGIIIIRGNRIDAVGNGKLTKPPKGAKLIDASGKYVIPGLMDSNAHLCLLHDWTPEIIARYEGRLEDLIEEAAQVSLKYGNTTVFDTWGPLRPLMNVRDRINKSETIGSRMFVAGNIIGLSGPMGRDFNPDAEKTATREFVKRINAIWEENVGPDLGYLTPEQIREAIQKYISRGVDFLKYASSGHIHESFIAFSEEVQKAIVEEAHKAGLTIQAHTTSAESLRMAIEAGVDLITHVAITGSVAIPEKTMSILAEKKIACGIFPIIKERDEEMKKSPKDAPNYKRYETSTQNTQRVLKAGIPVLLCTDGGLWDHDYVLQYKPETWSFYESYSGEGLLLRCISLVEMGVSPMEAIMAVTRNPAAAYHKLDQIGTIEKGKLADLVILDGNPLADINNIRNISIVIKDGQLIDRDKLPVKKILYPQPYRR